MIGPITWVAPRAAVARRFKLRLAAALLCFSAALLPTSLPAQQVSAALRNAVQQSGGRVIIRLSQQGGAAALRVAGDPLVSATAAAAVARNLDNRYAAKARGRALRFGMLFAEVSADRLDALAADPAVESVEADFVSDLAEVRRDWPALGVVLRDRTPDTVGWGVTKINAPAAWSAGVTGAGVKVGIMDSGIDIAHPDLGVSGGFDFTTSSASPTAYDDNIGICNGHGTHVAGIVAARQNGSGVIGVAPDAQLYSLKVFEIIDGGCKAWGSNQIAALDWAVANGIKVVSISIGGTTFSQSYQDAVTTATNAGVVVVAAAGNNSSTVLNFPGAYSGVTAVGSVNSSNIRSSWSNTGNNLWLAAPGEGIVSTMPGGGTGSKSGTSMATPHVSGLVALYFQSSPGASAAQVRNALRDVAIDIDAAGWDVGTGWGLAQAAGIGSAPPPPPPPPPPVPLAMSVAPASRSITAQAGSAVGGDSATVTLSGDNSGSTAWSATKRKAWTTLTVASGTGSGKVKWNRSTSG
ncbi:MAG: S8 family serine peptidase, partial [Gemmatimonadales bacterium]|nr:S8 family serine peptidase [Gemmatimonadales bacterium]